MSRVQHIGKSLFISKIVIPCLYNLPSRAELPNWEGKKAIKKNLLPNLSSCLSPFGCDVVLLEHSWMIERIQLRLYGSAGCVSVALSADLPVSLVMISPDLRSLAKETRTKLFR
jgi:hypothetical protein